MVRGASHKHVYIFEMSFFKKFEIGLEIGSRVSLNCLMAF